MPTDTIGVIHSDPGAWTNGHVYAALAYVRPVTPNGLLYQTTAGGTSAGSEPTWPLVIGSTVVDNSVTWTCVNDLNVLTLLGTPTITVPLNGDTGVPQAIVTAINMITDWLAAFAGIFSLANIWTGKQTFNGTGTQVAVTDDASGAGLKGTGAAGAPGIYGVGGAAGQGVEGVGTGAGAGVTGVGGSTSGGGPGGIFTAGTTGNDGAQGTGIGTGNGGTFTGGATGAGVSAIGGTGSAAVGVLATATGSNTNNFALRAVNSHTGGTAISASGSGSQPAVAVTALGAGAAVDADASSGTGPGASLVGNGTRGPLHIAPSATPTAADALVGDFYVDNSGGLWFCATAGTWTQITVP